jgi:hypothetical protein
MTTRNDNVEWSKIPSSELARLDETLDHEKRKIKFLKWLDGGYSGSPVALVEDSPSGRRSMERILKFCSHGQTEAQGIAAAYENAPREFKSLHLVEMKRSFPLDDWWAMIMEIAGGNLSSMSLADYATDESLADICSRLVRSLLFEWNAGEREVSEELTVGCFLQRVIGAHKMQPGGSLHEFASRSNIQWDDPWIRRDGWDDWLRNPLTMLPSESDVKLSAIVGVGHGDLSAFNVLIPGLPNIDPLAYWLIDYGTSTPSQPLTRDPMYLLLSLATQWLQQINISGEASRSLVKLLAFAEDSVKSIYIAPFQRVRNEILRAGQEWANSQSRGHHWTQQSQLSVVGCALTFIGRQIGPLLTADTDSWLFDLACVAATEYSRAHERNSSVPLPPPPPSAPTPTPTSSLASSIIGEPTGNGSIDVLVQVLCNSVFGDASWVQLELGTRDLRPLLSSTYEITFESAARIEGLIGELRRTIDSAINPLASQRQLSIACRRSEDLREHLLALLRP